MRSLNPSKIRERIHLWWKARSTRPQAYEDARELCAVAGPGNIAEEYGVWEDWDVLGDPRRVAEAYARAAYRPAAFKAARDGALAGFDEYRRAHR